MPLEPCQPIDVRRLDRFRPPHCPHPDCAAHTHRGPGYACTKDGHYRRRCEPRRRERRYRCATCQRRFSRRSFSTSYRLKRPELLQPVAGLLVACASLRQIARHLGCAPSTVQRLSERLGRHAALFQRRAVHEIPSIDEPVGFDHFVTFVRSQVERLDIGTPVGQRSWFGFPMAAVRSRAAGRRSRRKRPLARPVAPTDPRALVRSTRKTLEWLVRRAPDGLDLVSDDHPAYPVAVRSFAGRIRHRAYANPDRSPGADPRPARIRDRELWVVDLVHKLLRHCQSHHRRETIAFGRRVANILGRAELFGVWRNFIKLVTERRPTTETPAIRIGVTRMRWTWRDVLAERLFERRIPAL